MAIEIKKNNWTRFFKKFNATNQYRQAAVSVKREGENKIQINQGSPFMGLAITRKGRLIDGIDFFIGQYDPERLIEPIVTVKQPVRLVLDEDADGGDSCLSVQAKDGSLVHVVLSGEKDPQQYHSFVEKVAYSICERRGFAPGSNLDDWLEAERKIKEAESQFVR